MSEDRLSIEFTSERIADTSFRKELEELHDRHIRPDEVGSDSSKEYPDGRAVYFNSFYTVDTSKLAPLLTKLEGKGVKDLVAKAWSDSTGEETLLICKDGDLLSFESGKELADYLAEAEEEVPELQVSYGKEGIGRTALIRLQVKVEKKRKVLQKLFADLIRTADTESFKETFNSLIVGKKFEVEWCKFRTVYDREAGDFGDWWEEGTDELLQAFTDVVEADKFLLLALDLEKASNPRLSGGFSLIFYELDGVSKVWIKYRPRPSRRFLLYLTQPGMGDSPHFVDKKIPNENDWPKPRG